MRCRKARWYLSARCDGTLSERQRARLDEHLAGCEMCRREAFYFSEIAALSSRIETRSVRPDFNLRLKAAIRRAENEAAAPVSWKSRLAWLFWRPALVTASVVALGLCGLGAYSFVSGDEAKYVDSKSPKRAIDPQYGIAVQPGQGQLPSGSLIPVEGLDPEALRLRQQYLEAWQLPRDYVLGAERLDDSNMQSPAQRFLMPTVTQEQVLQKVSY